MTDNVQKIREKIEIVVDRRLNLLNGDYFDLNEEVDGFTNEIMDIIVSLQEEPVSIWHDASKKSDNPEDVIIINPSDNTGEVLTKCIGVNQGHIWAYTSELLKLDNPCNIEKNLQEPQVKESVEIQHVNDMCKENGNSLTKESVSEDLEEAMQHNAPNNIGIDDLLYWRNGFIAGAKWQNEKNKQWLADNHKQIFNNGFEEGFEAGRDDMEEQLKKNAIYGEWFRRGIVLPSEYNADDVKTVKITIWQDGV